MAVVRAVTGNRRLLLVIDDAWRSDSALALRLGGPGCAHLLSTRAQAMAQDFAGCNAWLVLSEPEAPLSRRPGATRDLTLAEVVGLSEAMLDEGARWALYALSVFPAKPNSFE